MILSYHCKKRLMMICGFHFRSKQIIFSIATPPGYTCGIPKPQQSSIRRFGDGHQASCLMPKNFLLSGKKQDRSAFIIIDKCTKCTFAECFFVFKLWTLDITLVVHVHLPLCKSFNYRRRGRPFLKRYSLLIFISSCLPFFIYYIISQIHFTIYSGLGAAHQLSFCLWWIIKKQSI